VGPWLVERTMQHDPIYASGDLDATTEQAWMDTRLKRLDELMQWTELQDIPLRSSFDPHNYNPSP
jgi:hypothetical protein